MVLVLNGVLQEECPLDSRSLYHAHPIYRETGARLLTIPNEIVNPVGLLYVQQRELAATVPHDSKYNDFKSTFAQFFVQSGLVVITVFGHQNGGRRHCYSVLISVFFLLVLQRTLAYQDLMMLQLVLLLSSGIQVSFNLLSIYYINSDNKMATVGHFTI